MRKYAYYCHFDSQPRDKQIETRTADGRRRITPIFLAPQPDIGFVNLYKLL